MDIDIRTLLSRLNAECKTAMTRAAELCVRETHFNVDPEHLLVNLLDPIAPDLALILPAFGIQPELIQGQLRKALEGFKRGNGRTPALSAHLAPLLQEAWLMSSMLLGQQQVRSGTLMLALLEVDSLRGLLLDSAPGLLVIPRGQLRERLAALLAESTESGGLPAAVAASAVSPVAPGAVAEGARMPSLAAGAATPALDQYTVDVTRQAREGRLDPVRGRDGEIRQIIDVLLRRRQNNPILAGEAGVGKTAVVEGFAQRVIAGDVPPALREVSVRALDLALLQAGAGVKGEFENRLKSVIAEVKASATPVILFIDEAHQLIGAGGAEGQGDAANLLKPALARGELRTIAATTWAEYKRYVERDPALARRFQVVKVDEPEPEAAMEMLRGVVPTLQKHHGVEIIDEAVREAVLLSHRYISGRQLPDKAVSVLDTACARVALGQCGTPAPIEALARQIESLRGRLGVLRRERATGADHAAAITDAEAELADLVARRDTLQAKLDQERAAVAEIVALRRQAQEQADAASGAATGAGRAGIAQPSRAAAPADDDSPDYAARLGRLMKGLEALQEDDPLIPVNVDAAQVAEVISGWTGIPVGKMLADELHTVLHLKDRLAERVVGQDPGLDAIARRVRTFRAELDDPVKPVGVFMLVGPSGVGKTETACALADLLYGGERNMVTVNMSEFQEAHSVSSLKGAPPGYVGYGRGGVLTEAVRRRPYSVVLLDEMEKAHPDVLELFFQVFDKGTMDDGEGVSVDFRNTLIVLTSNAAQDVITDACAGGRRPAPEELVAKLRPALLRQFSPAFLARLVLVPYYPLADAQIRRIVGLKLGRLAERFDANHHARFSWDEAVTDAITRRCTEVDSGARNVDDILTQSVLPELSTLVLERLSMAEPFDQIHMSLGADGRFAFRFGARGAGVRA
ncbi:type VI secretion system ATPase TssH [Derxia gummosa]|uniref:Type VI secretion system ATPase TssH n=1 Tax=Derxia gummosa DSM 723 TaxID=1121388 RepID=A0A8B6X4F2_9BURK|nr:type VI secretion system ATPase TssH [Derxia gummosa]